MKIKLLIKNYTHFKNEILRDYTGDFEMVVKISFYDHLWETHIRIRKTTEDEGFIIAFDQYYESEVAIFNGCFYEKDAPQFNLVNRSQYGNGCDCKHEIFG